MLSNSNSIEDLYKKISGGLNFKGVLSIDQSYQFVSQFLTKELKDEKFVVDSGWYYLLETSPISAHYNVEGFDISYRDCLIIKNGKEIKNITSSDVVVYDMMDKDVIHTKEFQQVSSYLDKKIDDVDNKLSDYIEESELPEKIGTNINFWYDNKDLSIYLSAGNHLYGVDTTDFI